MLPEVAGFAAEKAEKEKQDHYPARSGRAVWPVAHETWGRLGTIAESLLLACGAASARRAYRCGRIAGGRLRQWRARLDATLHRGIASQLASSRFGLPGACRRAAPIDRACVESKCGL